MEEILLTLEPEINRPEAQKRAREKIPEDAMLLAWFDRRTGSGSPAAFANESEEYVERYARSRGAKAKVVVNDAFAFYYAPGTVDQP